MDRDYDGTLKEVPVPFFMEGVGGLLRKKELKQTAYKVKVSVAINLQ